MYGFKECSSYGTLYNREHCCSNVSSVDNFVRDPNPSSYDETPDSSQQVPHNCSKCGGPFGGLYCRQCTCERCRRNYTDEVCTLCCYEVEKSFVNDSNPNSLIDSLNIFNPPPQPQTYSCEFCGNNAHYGYDCPPQSEDSSDIESECDVPVCDNFTTFSNPLFDADDVFSSSDDESFSDEDVLKEIYSNPLFDEEIISTKIDPHHFNAESDLIESLLNRDTLIISSPKFDSLLEEFSGELAHIDLIPPGINEADFDPEEEIRLVEKLLYDNSSPRPPEEFNSENSDAIIESFSPSPIPVEDSDSLMEEIDLFLTPDDSMPPGIENDDYDSEGDILFLEELLSNDSPSLPENESFHFDVPSSPRPPAKPPDDGIYFEPDTGLLTAKVVGDISKHYVLMPRLLPTQPTVCPVIDTLRLFLSENEDKVHILSHRGFKAFQLFSESPMMIYGGNIPTLDVPIAPDYEDPRARGFVHRSLDLQSMLLGIRYP
ncbi:hypothetical protein Tco_1372555 [Tanacetum coccineum]